jgi:hypothetical protein
MNGNIGPMFPITADNEKQRPVAPDDFRYLTRTATTARARNINTTITVAAAVTTNTTSAAAEKKRLFPAGDDGGREKKD